MRVFRNPAWSGFIVLSMALPAFASPVDMAEALDAPGFTPGAPTGWSGLAGIGHDGADAAFSPASPSPHAQYSPSLASDRLVYNNPWPNASIDAGFWWNKLSGGGQLSFVATGLPADLYQIAMQTYGGYGFGWQNMRIHYDRAPSQVDWRLTTWHPFTVVPSGSCHVDKFTWLSGEEDSFSKALDTDQPGSAIAAAGWNAVGDAIASVQNSVTWQGGDALEIRAAADGKPLQKTTIIAYFHTDADFSCRVKRGSRSDCSLTLFRDSDNSSSVSIPLTEAWTEFRDLLVALHPGNMRRVSFEVSVPAGSPDAVVYLDAVSLVPANDLNVALETNGLTWTSGGAGQRILSGWYVLTSESPPDYAGYLDGVKFSGLAPGEESWVETPVTGPGTFVFAGFAPTDSFRSDAVSLQVDGVTMDALGPAMIKGAYRLQASVPQGVHHVRWRGSIDSPGSIELHSAAFIPGPPESHLPAALESLSQDQTWLAGGTRPPVPLYGLREGATTLAGLSFPALAAGESSWLETSIDGPAKAEFFWQSAAPAYCRVDGRKAARSVREPFGNRRTDPFVGLDLPSGPHTVRWEGGAATAELRRFSATPGSDIASFLAGVSTPPLVWNGLSGPWPDFQPWKIVNDGPLWTFDSDGNRIELPGTGLPVLTGNDRALGGFWFTGPAVLSFDARRGDWSSLRLGVDEGAFEIYHPGGSIWQPAAVVIPAGEHEITFHVEEEDDDSEDYVRLKNFRITRGAAYPDWAASFGLGPASSSLLADPDLDGRENLLEFAFGTDPGNDGGDGLPEPTGTPPNRQLQFPSLPHDATGLTYEVQVSTDLQTWSTVATVIPNASNEQGPAVPLPPPAASREFVRVRVHL